MLDYRQPRIAQYRLAWTCFNDLYVQKQPGSTASLPEPTPQLWQAIANMHNHCRHQLSKPTPECTAQEIKSWLEKSVKYIRAYLFPRIKSLNTFKPDSDTEQTIDLPDPNSDDSLTELIASEEIKDRQNQISQMYDVLSKALQGLDANSQEILKLYYQEDLTQQQIMHSLGKSQPTVSRKLVKGRECLLKALVEWSLDLNISVNPNQINNMSIALEEWLRTQFGLDINP